MSIKAIKNTIVKNDLIPNAVILPTQQLFDIYNYTPKTDDDGVKYKEKTLIKNSSIQSLNDEKTNLLAQKADITSRINDIDTYITKITEAQAVV